MFPIYGKVPVSDVGLNSQTPLVDYGTMSIAVLSTGGCV